ncbi:uncharacterized protein BCR38DRAFT_456783 [Pseudomassariella vexata]|uniref:DUF4038 domain-containing protein n=1 Tax=Pseudomassariella vexata TaxID=1141098 RepID=A0A1Y2E3Y6_9PEZI|nr:uncharacterized protein BCR38DRAFT_456783 [Pseudomassariella vexata]ORY66157.1 hypothetical protein BCR38DRAFT_456783 [Pseudomassariella vexata]
MLLRAHSWFLLLWARSVWKVVAVWQVPLEYALTPSQDGHFLQDSDGEPFFWQADTAWLLFHRLNYSECETYLSDRARKGFNMVLAVGFTQIGIDSPNRNGDLTFVDEDVTRPNEPYWAYMDSIIKLAWSKGIRIALVPAWGYYVHSDHPENMGSVLNKSTARNFGTFIGQRYPYLPKLLFADTNPWWLNKTAVKDDYAAGGVPPQHQHIDWTPIYDELANGLVVGERNAVASQHKQLSKSIEPSKWWPLMTIHPTNQWFSGGPVALASAFVGARPWLTLDTSQSGHVDYPPNPPLPWWNCRRGWETVELMYAVGENTLGRKRPALDNEPHYENRYNNGKSANAYWNASDVRAGSWQAVFSGATGATYGADNVMQMYIPGLFDPAGSGPAIAWSDDIHLPGASQMQHIRNVVLDRGRNSYFSRIPAQGIIVGDAGTNDQRVTATRDTKGSWIMVYSPTGQNFSIDTRSLSGCEVQASWYDPVTGGYATFEYAQCDGLGSLKQFIPPRVDSHTDWVLVLEL